MIIRPYILLIFLGLVGLLTASQSTIASTNVQEAQYKQQRAIYTKALRALEKGNVREFKKYSAQLKDYPLKPYLEYFFNLRYISNTPQETIEGFITTYQDTPLAGRMRHHWHKSLARRKQWQALINHYEPGQNTTLDCYYYWAQLKTGNQDLAFQGAQRLWNVGKSQVKACDPLFERWKKSDQFDPAIAWQRAQKAIANRKLQLSQYLERFITPAQQKITQEWRRTYRNPQRLKQTSRYTNLGEDAKLVIISGFKRLVRKDYKLAIELWPNYENGFAITPEEKAQLYNFFARNMAVNYYPEAEDWLDNALLYPNQEDLIRYGIRHALRDYDWQRVKQWISMLSPAERGSGKWRYWEAKAEQVIGEYQSPLVQFALTQQDQENSNVTKTHTNIDSTLSFDPLNTHKQFLEGLTNGDKFLNLLPQYSLSLLDNGFTPRELFDSLTQERSFYGFITSAQQNKPLSLNHANSNISEEELQRILQHPGIVRARELSLLKEEVYAQREWYAAISSMPTEMRGTAAHVAHLWGWHNQAIIAASRSDIRDNLELRFPKAYFETVSSHAQSRGLASDWVYSLIRQESAFRPGAKSGVGALGIMQIMPSTARQVSKRAGIKLKSKHQLLDPYKNIKIGTAYLDQLLNRFDGNLVLATAAYNAGPHRAKRWQPEYKPMEGDIWIETIPIHETRNYVKNIFTYQAIYRHNLGMEARLSDSLKAIQPKNNSSIATN